MSNCFVTKTSYCNRHKIMHQHKLTDHKKENAVLLQSTNYDILGVHNNSGPLQPAVRSAIQTGLGPSISKTVQPQMYSSALYGSDVSDCHSATYCSVCSVQGILFYCVVLCTDCVYKCTVLLPPGVNPAAVNEYIVS
jgi:hypothetical protein